jgi:hypothetical protein
LTDQDLKDLGVVLGGRARPPPIRLEPICRGRIGLPRLRLLTSANLASPYEEEAAQYSATDEPAGSSEFEPHFNLQDFNRVEYDTRQTHDEPDERNKHERTGLGGLARLLVLLIFLGGVVAAISLWSSTAVELQSKVTRKSGRVSPEQEIPVGAGSTQSTGTRRAANK